MKLLLPLLVVLLSILKCSSQGSIATLPGITSIKAIDDKVFFTADHELYGSELLISDGSKGNIKLVKDINPGSGSSPSQFTVFNNHLFFTAYTAEFGLSLWKSDGTSEGTTMIYGVRDSYPQDLMVFKDKLYFTTNLGSIICTDGTPEGTKVFFQSINTYGRIGTIVKNDQYIYFTSGGRTIYRDDGSTRIEFLGPLSWEDVYYRNLFLLDNTLVVVKASTYSQVIRIYSISNDVLGDQVEDEWQLIKKLDAPIYGRQELDNFTYLSGKLFFTFRTYYDNVPPTDELWICDGTEAGTRLVKSFDWYPHSSNSQMGMFFTSHDMLFFRGGALVNQALWTSDGTTEGTTKFHDVAITPSYNDARPPVLVTENKIYFSGVNGGNVGNVGLWESDGTPGGTREIFDLEDAEGNAPRDFSFSNGILYFATSQQFSSTLWSTKPASDISVSSQGNPIKSGSKPYLFYNIAKGECSPRDVLIKNKGLKDLYLSSIFVTGMDFYLAQQSIPERIGPNESITMQIVFNPITDGTSRATLTIQSSDIDEPNYVIYLEATSATYEAMEICQFENRYVKRIKPGEVSRPIVLSNSSVAEGQPIGFVIGEFSSPTGAAFQLAAGEGDIDNEYFFIEGPLLKSNAVFNLSTRTLYTLRVKATSQVGESEASFRIHVTNTSFGFTDGGCQPRFENVGFNYTSLEVNAEGYLFATTSRGQILRSKNSGQSWEVVYAQNYYRLSGITFKGTTGFAYGSKILLKSEDSGTTWFSVYIPLTGEYYFSDFGTFFFNDHEGYVATEEGEIFFTKDGGRTWDKRMDYDWNEFRKLFFTSKENGFSTIGWGDLLRTTDGGRSWSVVDLSALGFNKRVRDLWFLNENDGFIIGEYKFYATSDGGVTWIEDPTVSGTSVSKIKFLNQNLGFLLGGYGMMYKTTNGGDTWSLVYPGIYPSEVNGVAQSSGKIFITTKDGYYSNESARALAVSSDQGETWSSINHFPDGNIYQIDFSNDKKGMVIGENGIFKTDDNGLTWKETVSDISNISDSYFIDENSVIFLSNGHIFKSNDGGRTTRKVLTTEQGNPYLPAGRFYAYSGNILFSISWYSVYRSDDLGETWELVQSNPGNYLQSMHFISSTIGYRIELFGSVEKTVDGGKTWTVIYTRDPAASDAYNDIFFINESVGYKGGKYLQRTTNGGTSWENVIWPFYDIIAVHFYNENHGYVISRGNVYETNNAGSTWQIIFYASSNLSNVQFTSHGIFLAGEDGFVARMNTTPGTPPLPGYIYGPGKVCPGDAAEFHVAVTSDYRTQWSTTAGSIEDHTDYITVNFPDPGEYIITAKHFNFCGESEMRTTTVVASALPDEPIIEGPNPSTIGGLDVVYTVTNATDDSKFYWEVEGSTSISPVDDVIVIDWASEGESGEIKVFTVDPSGCRAYGTLVVELGMPLGIEPNSLNRVSVYPNPSEGDTKIASSQNGLISVRILDTLGREYSRILFYGGEEQTIPTRQLPSGLYIVEISDGHQSVTKKLVKK
jgi:ELWxxDGT repeat protein